MPYIPPPPRPPAPPRIVAPPPPRIPTHNHFQNQQRIHQQQQFHQQQQRQLQQHHLQQQRFHQNIIMENQRRHQQQQQLHQQQQQRQRQALEFQRQQERLRQEQFRRQQDQLRQDQLRRQQEQQRQEQLRRQQQDQLRNRSSQQDFLKNYQQSSGLNGSTVVNISPGIYVETSDSSVPLGDWITAQVELNLGQQQAAPPTPSPQPSAPPPPAAMSGSPSSAPPLSTAPQAAPPPYSPPQTTPQPGPNVPNSIGATPPTAASSATQKPHPQAATAAAAASLPKPKPRDPPNNTIALKDGSIIVLKAEDEILFRGPSGIEMIVNCLPLYDPLPMPAEEDGNSSDPKKPSAEGSDSDKASSASPQNAEQSKDKTPPRKSFSLIKAKSMEALDVVTRELELHDHDTEMKRSHEALASNSVSLPPRTWSRSYGKNVTVVVHSNPQQSPGMGTQLSRSHENLAGHPALRSPPSAPSILEGTKVEDVNKEVLQEEEKEAKTSISEGDVEEHKTVEEGGEKTLAENESSAKKRDEMEPKSSEAVGEVSQESSSTESPQANATTEGLQESEVASKQVDGQESKSGKDVEHLNDKENLQKEEEPSQSKPVELDRQEEKDQEEKKNQDSKETVENKSDGDSSQNVLDKKVESAPEDAKKPDSSGATPEAHSPSTSQDQSPKTPSPSTKWSQASPKKDSSKKRLRSSKSMSPTHLEENGGSDDESSAPEFHLNYIDPPTMSTLKRSSGSVSFISRQSVSPVMVLGAETSVEVIVEEAPNQSSNEEDPGTVKKPPIVEEAASVASQANSSPSAPPQESNTPPDQRPPSLLQYSVSEVLIPSPLPDPPATMEASYVERSGWLMKLSHRKGVFGDKWQKRYFVLHRSWLYYFKKYGDSNPRGAVRLLPTGWCRPIAQGTQRMNDAVAKSEQSKIISVLRCVAVHRPSNFVASLCDLLDTDGVAETFRSTTLSVTNTQHFSRTYYMVAPSDTERESWVESISNNIRAYSHSVEALSNASKELKIMLRAVHSTLEPKHIPALLYLIHNKRRTLFPTDAHN